ncbi:methyl-accepting chemotaxis protein [Herbaspirillum sp. VT-16-41]|uniref:methyl-accepting chemotaxis protein n=1 Tax=Herbaspirillum sp. VT-16-41 TaxID=1953765 RepID=UPI000980DC03|nr:methyl-accepting chemotaxis protein [Herbaspirillum sp. VT-16-41]ONN67174.1 methyl-accepting chemotaxis protein [Herbaspirillum sp. VT-16-41]
MNWFYNRRIATKLLLAFACLLLLTGALGGFAVLQINQVNQATGELASNWLPSIRSLNDLKVALSRLRANEAQMALYDDDATQRKAIVAIMNKNLETLALARKTYAAQISEPGEKALFPSVNERIEKFIALHGQTIADIEAGRADEAKRVLLGQAFQNYLSLLDEIDKLAQVNLDGSVQSTRTAEATYQQARVWVVSILAGALLAGLALALFIARVISTPLRTAGEFAHRIAAGDLTAEIAAQSRDETGQLTEALVSMNTSLRRIVSQVRSGTDTIATASGQISSGNLDLSSRTEEQASSLEETASAMEELTSTVRQNAENARQANQLALSASTIAEEGGNVVRQVIQTMGRIDTSSKKIVDIISVIDGIAFQTNILALNAAVEAARAGEQGRGFAVVATEVRSLAQRSATAAKEIKTLIDNSVEQVGLGSGLVQQAGVTISEVVSSVQRVTDVMAEISAASNEQTQGIEQVNQAITQMDEVTQQNAALVEEAASASHSLSHQTRQLSELVGVFRLPGGPRAQAASPEIIDESAPLPPRAVRLGHPRPGPARAHSAVLAGSAGAAAGHGAADDAWETF